LLDDLILRDLGVILVAAAVIALLARPARIPTIVAYIVTGLALGPFTGLVEVSETLELTSELGIALLLFLVGLELSFDKVKGVGKVALAAGLGQVVFTAAGGFVLALLMGFTAMEGIFVATALTFSSTVVVVKLLGEKRELDSLYGRIAVGIFLVQDLVVIVFLTVLAGLGQGTERDFASVAFGIVKAFLGMGVLLAVALVSSRYLLTRAFGWISRSLEALFIWSLCWCFFFVLGAEVLGLSLEIGAFLAGISLAQLPYSAELRRRVHPLVNFFIAVFFVTLGIQMELGGAATIAWPAAVFSVFVLLGNPLIFLLIIGRMGYGTRTAFLTSVTVAQISEFSFIFAAMGLGAGLIGPEILSMIAVVGLVTIAVSAYMILYNHQLYALMQRWRALRFLRVGEVGPRDLEPEAVDGHDPAVGLTDHVIVVGMNSLGRRIVERLREAGEQTLAVDLDPRKLAMVPGSTLLGNTEDLAVLEAAGIRRARLLVSALQIEDANNLLGYRCRSLGVPCSIHAFDAAVTPDLREIGVTHLMDSKTAGTRRLSEALRAEGVYG
jgi:Kef-type K+ transport system membrane component KefB